MDIKACKIDIEKYERDINNLTKEIHILESERGKKMPISDYEEMLSKYFSLLDERDKLRCSVWKIKKEVLDYETNR